MENNNTLLVSTIINLFLKKIEIEFGKICKLKHIVAHIILN